jgi:cell division protein FtsW
MPISSWRETVDQPVFWSAIALLALGAVLSMAAGPAAAERIGFADPFHFVFRHAVFVAVSTAILLCASIIDPVWVRRLAAVLFFTFLVLAAMTIFIGGEVKGARRWIGFAGQTFQPSEILKPTLVVLVAWLLAQRARFAEAPWATIGFVLYAIMIGLLVLQPDIGQAFLTTAAFFTVFIVAGMPVAWLLIMFVLGVALAAMSYMVFPHVRDRIHSFINPTQADTYQIDKAHEAITRGGLFGVGPGEGEIKRLLPDAHTDFVYAVAAEEFGLVVCLALIGAFAFLTVRGVLIASRTPDPYQRAAAVGLFALFGLQAAINISVNLSLVPPKGMTLPLISSGGSSLIGSALTLGFALALTRRHKVASPAKRKSQ